MKNQQEDKSLKVAPQSHHKGDNSRDILGLGFLLVLVPLAVAGAEMQKVDINKSSPSSCGALVRKCKKIKRKKNKCTEGKTYQTMKTGFCRGQHRTWGVED